MWTVRAGIPAPAVSAEPRWSPRTAAGITRGLVSVGSHRLRVAYR
ncbi:hypothetical protein HUW46_08037 [Amycolatopsis sp. CA-230715]|nr:hypothetical protein HUW46_08037 [Amycolatopsis sp. CA-230715]